MSVPTFSSSSPKTTAKKNSTTSSAIPTNGITSPVNPLPNPSSPHSPYISHKPGPNPSPPNPPLPSIQKPTPGPPKNPSHEAWTFNVPPSQPSPPPFANSRTAHSVTSPLYEPPKIRLIESQVRILSPRPLPFLTLIGSISGATATPRSSA